MRAADTDLAALALKRSVKESGVAGEAVAIPRLKWTRREGEAIVGMAGQSLAKFDFDASLAAATGPELAQYRFVHFATHGLWTASIPNCQGSYCHWWTSRASP